MFFNKMSLTRDSFLIPFPKKSCHLTKENKNSKTRITPNTLTFVLDFTFLDRSKEGVVWFV